ncbi:HNH endonuclease family protein [Actinomycetaceae bacterium MB13-C1-2]|nr:HNH endonuclease family protein [Actinomycetaceae bacterium MB13-C1-2]
MIFENHRYPRRSASGLRTGHLWRNTLVFAIAIGVVAWLLVPGIGPNILQLPEVQGPWSRAGAGNNPDLLADLDSLSIRGRTDVPDYRRTEFGDGWADLDGDGCSTRNEVLARDLTEITYRESSNPCVVDTGVLDDPYSSGLIDFQRGEQTSQEVQIDHVVPLADAWYSGAWRWDPPTRYQFANDPLNLLAVDGGANFEKGAKTADQWLPSNKDFQCEYVGRQVTVKHRYALSVTPAEAKAMRRVISKCPTLNVSTWD